MRDYGKVHTSFWSSASARSLSEDARALALYLLTCPHGTIAGVFRLPDGYACEDLQWTPDRVQQTLSELFANGFANRCETTKWAWVIKHFEWNPPENPNQRKAVAKIAAQIPDSCEWKLEFMRDCGRFWGLEQPEETNPSETLSEPFLNQEQEQEQKIYTSPSADVVSLPADRMPPCPHQSIADTYNRTLPELPAVRLLSDRRKRAIGTFWRWVLTSKKSDGKSRATTADEALGWIGDYFARARDNDFLMGRTARSGEHAGWRCDFDFLLTDKGKSHVIEKTRAVA